MVHHPIHCPGLLSELDPKKDYSTRELARIAKRKGYLGETRSEINFARGLKRRINKRDFPKGGHFVRYSPKTGLEATWLGSLWQTLLEKQSPLTSPVDTPTWFLFQQIRAILIHHFQDDGARHSEAFFKKLPAKVPKHLQKETRTFLAASENTHHHLWLIYLERQQSANTKENGGCNV